MAITRITAPVSAPVSLDEVKRHLRVETGDDDNYLASLIAACTDYLERVSGLALMTQTWRQYCDAVTPGSALRLAIAPVRSIAAVTVYGPDGTPAGVDLSALQLDAVSSPPRLLFTAPLPQSRALNGIEIDVEAGFGDTAAEVPDSLRRALLLLIAHAYEFRGAVPLDDQPASEPHGFRTLLAPFRRFSL